VVCLLDTNVAIRAVLPLEAEYAAIRKAMDRLTANGEIFVVSAQVLGEMWNLCTRPATARGGYGLTLLETDTVITEIVTLSKLLPEPPDLWAKQHRLLVTCAVSGVETHDCRIAAWCLLMGVDRILTLNDRDFKRFGVDTIHPDQV